MLGPENNYVVHILSRQMNSGILSFLSQEFELHKINTKQDVTNIFLTFHNSKPFEMKIEGDLMKTFLNSFE